MKWSPYNKDRDSNRNTDGHVMIEAETSVRYSPMPKTASEPRKVIERTLPLHVPKGACPCQHLGLKLSAWNTIKSCTPDLFSYSVTQQVAPRQALGHESRRWIGRRDHETFIAGGQRMESQLGSSEEDIRWNRGAQSWKTWKLYMSLSDLREEQVAA